MQKATLSPLQVKGVLPLDHPAVIVANHQSALDIPLIGSLLGRQPHTWLVLSYYTKFPVLGRFIRTMCVSVDKATPGKLAQAMMHAVKLATVSGRHMIIFPEGRRVTDGAIHCFRQGFALIARRSKRPVIPVVIKNAARVYPPDGWLIKRASLELIVGPAFVLQPAETDEQFCSRVRAWFVEHEPVC
jgi:1-acyl-sn-glycerol-3-phosphate acyltransferase